MNMQDILDGIYVEISKTPVSGRVADYIPELAHILPAKYGIHLVTLDGKDISAGDSAENFSIQSISKIFATALAFSNLGDGLWERVGMEPSGTAFNSLIQLEYEQGIPRNPLINAGAIVVADILTGLYRHPKEAFLEFMRLLSGNPLLNYDHSVALSEKNTGFRNMALGYFIKSYGNLKHDVYAVLDLYFNMCALSMSCRDLAMAGRMFVHHGSIPGTDIQILTSSQTKRLNALMQTCGFYDEAGEFTFRVGLPGKSGVGGGILAIHPQQYSVAVWSPPLNAKGNSIKGMMTLELLTTKTGLSIF
jgi:glutaminase